MPFLCSTTCNGMNFGAPTPEVLMPKSPILDETFERCLDHECRPLWMGLVLLSTRLQRVPRPSHSMRTQLKPAICNLEEGEPLAERDYAGCLEFGLSSLQKPDHFQMFLSYPVRVFVVVQSLNRVWFSQSHGLQHTRLLCPLLSPKSMLNFMSTEWVGRWWYLTISSSATLFLFLQSFPASGLSSESALRVIWPEYWSFSRLSIISHSSWITKALHYLVFAASHLGLSFSLSPWFAISLPPCWPFPSSNTLSLLLS